MIKLLDKLVIQYLVKRELMGPLFTVLNAADPHLQACDLIHIGVRDREQIDNAIAKWDKFLVEDKVYFLAKIIGDK